MIRDSQFSHILLLIVIGYAIYYLTSPEQMTSTIKNVGTVDTDDSNTNDPKPNYSNNASNVSDESIEVVSDESPEAKNVERRPSIEDESRGIISEVEEELQNNYQSEVSGADLGAEEGSAINSFKPSETEGGANLNNAFTRPIPKGSKCNTVDFNKNYLKKYDSKAYLPQEVNDEWFDTDFTQAKNKLNSDSLINTEKYVVGVDTVGQSLKNASHDIRGTIANPKFNVSPWNNSTYEPDYNIKPLN
jgi:hypothetical protein